MYFSEAGIYYSYGASGGLYIYIFKLVAIQAYAGRYKLILAGIDAYASGDTTAI